MIFEIGFETMLMIVDVFLSQKDGANVGIIFESANSFAKKMAFSLYIDNV